MGYRLGEREIAGVDLSESEARWNSASRSKAVRNEIADKVSNAAQARTGSGRKSPKHQTVRANSPMILCYCCRA